MLSKLFLVLLKAGFLLAYVLKKVLHKEVSRRIILLVSSASLNVFKAFYSISNLCTQRAT